MNELTLENGITIQIAENDFFTTVEILGTSFRKHLCFCYTVEQDGVQFVITDLNKKVLYTEQLKKPTLSNLSMLKIKTLLQNI